MIIEYFSDNEFFLHKEKLIIRENTLLSFIFYYKIDHKIRKADEIYLDYLCCYNHSLLMQ